MKDQLPMADADRTSYQCWIENATQLSVDKMHRAVGMLYKKYMHVVDTCKHVACAFYVHIVNATHVT